MLEQENSNVLENTLKKEGLRMLLITAFIFIIIFLITFATFYFIELNISNIQSENKRKAENTIVRLENDYFVEELSFVMGDLFYLHDAFFKELSAGSGFKNVAENWMIFSSKRYFYDQIRFIDSKGNEKIRVNFKDGKAHLVADSLLQNKADRYYFYETAALKENHVFISRLDLNIENGEIEMPIKPMIRFSMPVYSKAGEFKGVIILNYIASRLLENFKRLGNSSEGDIILLDQESYWLVGDNENTAWNFMYPSRHEQNFAAKYPDVWDKLEGEKGQILTPTAFYTYSKVDLYSKVKKYNKFHRDKINFSAGDWYIISRIDNARKNAYLFYHGFWQRTGFVLLNNAVIFISIFIFSILVAIGMYSRRQNFIKIKYYSEFDPLTNAYNRRAGIEKLHAIMPLEERRENDVSICFIDVNGLKLVNDNLGHEDGDELIKTVVTGIKEVIRVDDILIRLGGDEFLIVFAGIDESAAERVWQRIKYRYEVINKNEGRLYEISVSHGIVSHKYMRQTLIDDIIKQADEKMYEEKQAIKKNVCILRTSDSIA